MLQARNIEKQYGDRVLLHIPELRLYSGERIGLVGENGAGKTTLLELLSQGASNGSLDCRGRITYLPQFGLMEGAIDPVVQKRLGVRTLHPQLSGGEITRVKLARLLKEPSHLLLLDEPTANLDLFGISFLEEQLLKYPGAFVVVSHDQRLLDRVCTTIWELEDSLLHVYPGNFSAYQDLKQRGVLRQQLEYEQYQKEKERLERAAFWKKEQGAELRKTPKRMGNAEARLHRRSVGTVKAKFDKTVKALVSRVEALEVKERPREKSVARIDFHKGSALLGRFALKAQGVTKSFASRVIFNPSSFQVKVGEKVGIIGPNGSGKTTFLSMIQNRDQGIYLPPQVRVGRVSQDLSELTPTMGLLESLLKESVYQEDFVRTVLARLLFYGDAVYKRVSMLSGGERVKACFARLVVQDYNLLLLDEPTNYLDIPSKEALAAVIREYPGTIFLVSHDREFLVKTASMVLHMEKNQLLPFFGTYGEWEESQGRQAKKEEILLLEHRLAELNSLLSLGGLPTEEVALLDLEFHQKAKLLRSLRA